MNQQVGTAYLDHLTDSDLAVLSASHSRSGEVTAHYSTGELRCSPGLVEELLERAEAFEMVFGGLGDPAAFVDVSPFLVFALLVHRCRKDLAESSYVHEWLGLRQRIPVLGTDRLAAFLEDPWHRLYLAELLASYAHVVSGSYFVRTRRGWRRQRFSEMDPAGLVSLLEVVPKAELPGIYRRLGDLALFLTGVFPDHTARKGISEVAQARLRRSAGYELDPGAALPGAVGAPQHHGAVGTPQHGYAALPESLAPMGAVALLEQLGSRWYELAASSALIATTSELRVVAELSKSFGDARRVLNVITDRYLFAQRERWFGRAGDS
ncbi:MAG: hypothetical protein M1115_03635 [Actinobacteria bacterium]|nr:hypothetical protein [Actinomycetota bacterium]